MLFQDMCHSRTPTKDHGLCRLCAQCWNKTGSGLRWYRCWPKSAMFWLTTTPHLLHQLQQLITSSRSPRSPLPLPKPSAFISHGLMNSLPCDWHYFAFTPVKTASEQKLLIVLAVFVLYFLKWQQRQQYQWHFYVLWIIYLTFKKVKLCDYIPCGSSSGKRREE